MFDRIRALFKSRKPQTGVFTTKAFITEDNIKSIKFNKRYITKFYVRTWINRESIPYKYEFRGDFQGYLNPDQLVITHNN